MKQVKSCGAIVFTQENGVRQYVVIREAYGDGFFGFPKGHMETGETERETALREVREETGLSVALYGDFRGVDEHPLAAEGCPNVIKQNVYFLAEFSGQAAQPQASEVREVLLMDYATAMKSLRHESRRRLLFEAERYLNEHRG